MAKGYLLRLPDGSVIGCAGDNDTHPAMTEKGAKEFTQKVAGDFKLKSGDLKLEPRDAEYVRDVDC